VSWTDRDVFVKAQTYVALGALGRDAVHREKTPYATIMLEPGMMNYKAA